MRALVTGSRGFVGPWLIRHLRAAGDEVVALGSEVDITDAASVTDAVVSAAPEAVYHLAAQSHVGRSWSEPARTFEVNAAGTLHLLEAALACDRPPRVLLVSSAEVYGTLGPADLPVGESAPLRPFTPYGASKAAAELLGLQSWLGRGLKVVRARPFNHTGPGQSRAYVVPRLAEQVAAGNLRALHGGNLDARRDLTDVRDVVRAYRLLIEHGCPGEVYNVCSGRSVQVREIARRLLEIAGLDVPVIADPGQVRAVEIPELRGDPSLLHDATGWKPEVDIDDTLRTVLAWLSERPPAG